jgi:hypothetical protein
MEALWQTNVRLRDAARWRPSIDTVGSRQVGAELSLLVMLGAVAAVTTCFAPGGWRMPGHAILRGTLPMILGISLAPRRTAGLVMSFAAASTFGALRLGGMGLPNPASCAGLMCLGPAIDVALAGARPGWMLYLRFAVAGLVANLAAFAVRMAVGPMNFAMGGVPRRPITWAPGSGMGGGGGMGTGGGGGMGRGGGQALAAQTSVEHFLSTALVSFALFGAVAGLVCAMIWFCARPRTGGDAP